MTLSKRKPRNSYDWTELALVAKASPGEWICEDDPDRPKSAARDIRRGSPRVFAPAGSFDARHHRDGLYVRYLGVPLYPWRPDFLDGDPRTFDELERTLDPDQMPDDDLPWRLDVATALTSMTWAEYVADYKKRRKAEKKFKAESSTPNS